MSFCSERVVSRKVENEVFFDSFGQNDFLGLHFLVFIDGLKRRVCTSESTFVIVVLEHFLKIILLFGIR